MPETLAMRSKIEFPAHSGAFENRPTAASGASAGFACVLQLAGTASKASGMSILDDKLDATNVLVQFDMPCILLLGATGVH